MREGDPKLGTSIVAEYELMFSEPAVPSGAGVLHHHRLPLPDSPE